MSTTFCIIESPYAAPVGSVELARNIAYVRACMRDALVRGEVPFASHALYTLPGVLDDNDPKQRKQGIQGGFSVAEAFYHLSREWPMRYKLVRGFYQDRGWSGGMVEGLEDAAEKGQKREKRKLGPEWGKEFDHLWTLDAQGNLVRKEPNKVVATETEAA